jgi:hypothetical protein
MTGTTWSKFFWADWESDESLKLCSPGAQALWMRMLCVCAKTDGYLTIGGEALGAADMARLTGWPPRDVKAWWAELQRWKVFSVDRKGRAYSRRMIRDTKRAKIARENGKNGGNPSLGNGSTNAASVKPKPTKVPGVRARINHTPDSLSKTPQPPDGGRATNKEFEQAWSAWHADAAANRGKAEAWAEWTAAADLARGDAALLAAVISHLARLAAGPRQTRKAFHRWLRDRGFEAYAVAVAQPAAPWPGPPEVWAAVAEAKSDAFARSWLAGCTWQDVPSRTLVSGANTINRLRQEVGPLLRDMDIELEVRAA